MSPISSNFPPPPPPPNFNVDIWNIGEPLAAKNNPPTLKKGEGGLVYFALWINGILTSSFRYICEVLPTILSLGVWANIFLETFGPVFLASYNNIKMWYPITRPFRIIFAAMTSQSFHYLTSYFSSWKAVQLVQRGHPLSWSLKGAVLELVGYLISFCQNSEIHFFLKGGGCWAETQCFTNKISINNRICNLFLWFFNVQHSESLSLSLS